MKTTDKAKTRKGNMKTLLIAAGLAMVLGFGLGAWLGPALSTVRISLLTGYLALIMAMGTCYFVVDCRS